MTELFLKGRIVCKSTDRHLPRWEAKINSSFRSDVSHIHCKDAFEQSLLKSGFL